MDALPDNAGLLRDYLAVSDAPCPNCGYNLRGITSGACPECGDPLALALSRGAPKHGLFGSSMGLLAVGFLITALGTITEVFLSWQDRERTDWRAVLLLAGGAVAYGVPALLLWERRARILRLPVKRLRWICGASWVPILVGLLVLLVRR